MGTKDSDSCSRVAQYGLSWRASCSRRAGIPGDLRDNLFVRYSRIQISLEYVDLGTVNLDSGESGTSRNAKVED